MVKYIIFLILNLFAMVLCYLTNWLVVLFADEDGELPFPLSLWQTWDDSLDVDWFVKETVPAIFRYDFDSKYTRYESSSDLLRPYGRTRMYSHFKEGAAMTIFERLKRYVCRVLWLYRNCGYGFAFWLFGTNVYSSNMRYTENTDGFKYGYDKSKEWYSRPFIYKNERAFCKRIRWCILIGWKIDEGMGYHRAMIANRIAVRFIKGEQ